MIKYVVVMVSESYMGGWMLVVMVVCMVFFNDCDKYLCDEIKGYEWYELWY